ncbi:acyl-CoA dehydrogenase [Sphingobacteriaceae bacterium WQ 2009]|uniref:Acyl-CoA dehydrogenase n=1 Tax=Rhinopithecimicrobium faecis TaxID=2820698 RepID=A0A8T4H7B4_9SPHI|nr:acyl-CoA dehydrogenase [Sphingobacteriaceae bacterium WQ 2009]
MDSILSTAQQALIADQQGPSILCKKLTSQQLALCYEQGWFKIWVPKRLSGGQLDLIEGLQLLEELAYADGSLAWTVTLCAGANMFVGYIDPDGGRGIFSKKEICLGGSGQVAGTAVPQADGSYLITGHWRYATGSTHLTHFTANCAIVNAQGEPFMEAKKPLIKSFYFDREDVLIAYDWDSFGLESTASHSFSVEGLKVPADRSFVIDTQAVTLQYPLYQLPFQVFAACTLFVNYIGMYRRFMDLVEKEFILRAQDTSWFTTVGKTYLRKHDARFQATSSLIDEASDAIAQLWKKHLQGEDINPFIAPYLQQCTDIIYQTQQDVLFFYPLCGIVASQTKHALNIVFRNIFTASQHAMLLKKDR